MSDKTFKTCKYATCNYISIYVLERRIKAPLLLSTWSKVQIWINSICLAGWETPRLVVHYNLYNQSLGKQLCTLTLGKNSHLLATAVSYTRHKITMQRVQGILLVKMWLDKLCYVKNCTWDKPWPGNVYGKITARLKLQDSGWKNTKTEGKIYTFKQVCNTHLPLNKCDEQL